MIGKLIGPYELSVEAGVGGMGAVYRAVNTENDQIVAIKLLSHEYLDDLGLRTSFEREAKLVTALHHEAIVPIYKFGQEDGQPYLVVQYMPNGSLADRLLQGALSPGEMFPILDRICRAVDYAHEQGIIHRDIKPSNILFDEDNQAYLADFGIAMQATSRLASSPFNGTPAYLSPEQARDDGDIDGRCDIYALGIILFEALTGKLPFDGALPVTIIMQQIHNLAPPLQAVNRDLSPALDAVIQRALAKDPADRFSNASDLADAYRLAISDQHANPLTSSQSQSGTEQEEDGILSSDDAFLEEPANRPGLSIQPGYKENNPSKLTLAAETYLPKTRLNASPVGWQLAHLIALGFATLMGCVMAAGLVAFLNLPQRYLLFSNTTESVQLLFDSDTLTLINHTREALNLSGLSFLRTSSENETAVEYHATRWSQVAGDAQPALQPGGCFLLLLPEAADFSLEPGQSLPNVQGCANLQGWLIVNDPQTWFWIEDGGSQSFQVILNGEAIQNCSIAAGSCRFTPVSP